ncbi:MAG: VCBS repeat-containing protein [Planctomycetes bacterium]|nr:VCBS repeat-containing protein [Planctomycetota bacterium]
MSEYRLHRVLVAAAALLTASGSMAQVRFDRTGPAIPVTTGVRFDHNAVDVNGDGYVDAAALSFLMASNSTEYSIRLLDAVNRTVTTRQFPGGKGFLFTFGDYDGDGDQDLLSVGGNQPDNQIFFNDGSGNFAFRVTPVLPNVALGGRALAVDFDRDGDDDILCVNDQGLVLLYGNKGVFKDETARIALNSKVHGMIVADFNADGRPDICASTADSSKKIVIWHQDASGQFSSVSSFVAHSVKLPYLAAADIDSDGDLDIFAAENLGQDRLYEAKGGTWVDATSTRLPSPIRGLTIQNPSFVDLDEDGDLDLVIPKSKGFGTTVDRTRIYVNDGKGIYSDVTMAVMKEEGQFFADVLVQDFDLDGDVDLGFVETVGGASVLGVERNMTRQVAMPVTTKLNTTLVVDFYARAGYAPAGQMSLPLLSFGQQATAIGLGSFGFLSVDLTSMVIGPALSHTVTTGKATLTIPVPPIATLHGTDVYMQALVMHQPANPASWRMSNAAVTTLTR